MILSPPRRLPPSAMVWSRSFASVKPQHLSAPESLQICDDTDRFSSPASDRANTIIVAYEPVWAIGAPHPASPDHIRGVCRGTSPDTQRVA